MDDLPVGTLTRVVHPPVEKEVILRPPIFKDVDTLAKPPIEDTKADKWELLNARMRRYGMSKILTVMFMYAQSAQRPVVACLITGGTNSNAASPPTPTPALLVTRPSPSKYL